VAGRADGERDIYLDPIPLLEGEGGIRIALPSGQS
jgi:hypothetical protein